MSPNSSGFLGAAVTPNVTCAHTAMLIETSIEVVYPREQDRLLSRSIVENATARGVFYGTPHDRARREIALPGKARVFSILKCKAHRSRLIEGKRTAGGQSLIRDIQHANYTNASCFEEGEC